MAVRNGDFVLIWDYRYRECFGTQYGIRWPGLGQ